MKKIIFFVILLMAVETFAARYDKECFDEKVYSMCYKGGLLQLKMQPNLSAKKFDLACNEGNLTPACSRLAYLYHKGQGVRQDYKKALFFYKKTIKSNNTKFSRKLSRAYLGIAELYLNGQGVKKDLKQAKEYFGKGCDLGSQDSCDGYTKLNN